MGMSKLVKQSLEQGADIEQKDCWEVGMPEIMRVSSLHIAAMCGYVEVVKLLLENGASVSVVDRDSRTPLHAAVVINAHECVEHLLSHGSKVDTEDIMGMTPLHTAIYLGDLVMVNILLRYKASVVVPNSLGRFARHYSAAFPEIDAVLADVEENTAKSVAFAMGHHPRLGRGSIFFALDPEVLRMVLERV
jgi:ankyrin repeat protein